MSPEEIAKQIETLEGKAAELKTKLEAAKPEDAEDIKSSMKEITDRLETLETEKVEAGKAADIKAMKDQIETLTSRLETARKPHEGFSFKGGAPVPNEGDEVYGAEGAYSFFNDVKAARNGDQRAWKRIEEATQDSEGKAMVEGTDTAGGFLVPPQISNELIRIRDAGGVLRGLFSSQPIATDELRIAAIDNGLAVAWTAELAEKITSEFNFSELSTNVFTAAGLAVASNQLLQDSKFSIDQLINSDLAKRFVALEEIAFLNGSGVGQPLGIRNTAGVEVLPFTTRAVDIPALLDRITDGITQVYTDYFGAPDAIVMHPRTWGAIVKARETTSPSTYLIGAGNTAFGRRADEGLPGYGQGPLPRGDLFGVNVYTTPNVPVNLGDASDESAIFIGNFSEGLILDRQGITTDQSEHVFFTSNQTVFRSEERVGFTAARYPSAFKVIEGDGLKGI